MIFSIGYATKTIENFIAQLQQHGIDAVADVRSVPYSNVFAEYRQERLTASLKIAKIKYVYLGKELGPRSKDASHYDDSNQVQFDRLAKSQLFRQGIERLQRGLDSGLNIALMCAEKDPAICHRSLLVSYYIKRELGLDVKHIDHHGLLEAQSGLEKRLVSLQNLGSDMLSSEEEMEELAYQRQLEQTSYVLPE